MLTMAAEPSPAPETSSSSSSSHAIPGASNGCYEDSSDVIIVAESGSAELRVKVEEQEGEMGGNEEATGDSASGRDGRFFSTAAPDAPASTAGEGASSSVASLASLLAEDGEETVRARGAALSGASSSRPSSASSATTQRHASVFDVFSDLRNASAGNPDPSSRGAGAITTGLFGTHGRPKSSNSTTVSNAGSGSGNSSVVVVVDGANQGRTFSSSSARSILLSMDGNHSIGAAYCDPPPQNGAAPATYHHHHHHHHEPSMSDLTFLMREQDADLLESIHLKAANDDSGETPVLTSIHLGGGSGAASHHPHHHAGAAAMIPPIVPNLALEPQADTEGSALSTTATATGAENSGTTTGKEPVVDPTSGSVLLPSSSTSAPAVVAVGAGTRRRSSKPSSGASTRTLLVRRESGGASSATNDPGGGSGILAADDLLLVGGDGIAGGERSRMALSGEIWVLPPSPPDDAAVNIRTPYGNSSALAPAQGINIPSSPFKVGVDSSMSVALIPEDDSSLMTKTMGLSVKDDKGAFPDEATITAPVAAARGLVRSGSHDRRLNEAAQFAEAVGEPELSEQNYELRIIEEDRDADGGYADDSDDDDDATEIHVEGIVDAPKQRKGVMELVGVPGVVSFHIDEQRLDHPHKVRPQWPFKTKRTKGGFLDKLPENGASTSQDFVYKGIRANPPEIVSRGVTRGNYSCLHRKAWLECTDKYHRYGKNLRLYYRYWERLGFPTNMFFDWLDSKGEAAGQPLPELDECPRSQLDSDSVLYITDEQETRGYAVRFIVDESGRAVVVDVDNEVVRTGPEGWIFVLRDNIMYAAQKITTVKGHCKKRFHHSSFFGGKAVAAAGIFITDEHGVLQQVLPHSGHYRPGEAHMQRMLFFLHNQGVDLWSFQVDMQQILHVARDTDGTEKVEKKKKTETLRLTPAGLVACYLAHKARFIGEGIFSQIHRIKKADVATVTEALELIDDGSTSRTSVKEADTSH